MYICKDCGYIFQEPKEYCEDRTPSCAFEGGSFIENIKGCPKCEGSYEEVKECDCCGRYCFEEDIVKINNKNHCPECYESIRKEGITWKK